MTVPEQAFLAGFAQQVAALTVQALKDEGLYHDDRPPLTPDEAAVRLGVSRRVLGEMINGVDGQPPVLATVKVGAVRGDKRGPGMKGVRIEAGEIDRYLEQQRRLSAWSAAREA